LRTLEPSIRRVAAVVLLTFIALAATAVAPSRASADMGKVGWEKLDKKVQAGYIVGFLHAVRIAKGMEPTGYMARTYMTPPGAKPRDWLAMVNQLYKQKEHEKRTLSQVMVIAGNALAAKHGPEQVHSAAGLEALRLQIEKRRAEIRKEALQAQNDGDGSGEGGHAPEAKGAAEGATEPSKASDASGAAKPAGADEASD